MALTDWQQEGDAAAQGATSNQAHAGSFSYQIDAGTNYPNTALLIHKQSLNDAPTEGRITAWQYPSFNGSSEPRAYAFRYQDVDNHYGVAINDDTSTLYLAKKEAGGWTQVDSQSLTSYDGSVAWSQHRLTFWQDSGTLNVRLEQDTGSGYSAVATDMSDTNPSLGTGGGMGLQNSSQLSDFLHNSSNGAQNVFWDDVEVYW
jgi:hypothetical protein